MSIAGATPALSTMNGVVCCPTCGQAAIVEGRFGFQGAGEPIGRVRISCVDGHDWLMLADRVRLISPDDDLNALVGPSDHDVKVVAEGSE